MSFLENLATKLSDAGTLAGQKVNEFTQNAKNQSQYQKVNKEKVELLTALGTAYYEKYKMVPENEFPEIILKISECEDLVAKLQDESLLTTGKTSCLHCGKELLRGSKFCSSCGTKV